MIINKKTTTKKTIVCAALSLFVLSGCVTQKPALEGRLDANFGDAVKANIQAHAVAPTPAQKANTYIPAEPNRAALARKNYREGTVKEPIAINQKKAATKMDNITENNILELRLIADGDMDIPTPSDGSSIPESDTTEPPKEAKIWAYLGVVGGAGVTSLAVQTAWELSTTEIDGETANVLLVDLDFERGDCAAYLDTEPSINLAELNETEGRMDEDLAVTFIRPINANLSLLSAGSQMGGNDLLSTNALLSLLDVISSQFDFIILDVPPMWRAWTQAVIGAADKFALVTESRVPALHLAKKMAEDISEAMSLDDLPDILINKHERRALNGGLSLRDIHKVLDRETCTQISVDDETLRIAINTGKPASVVKPKSRYTKSVRDHVRAWRSLDVAKATHISRKRERRAARS